jgi:hypothetical protein
MPSEKRVIALRLDDETFAKLEAIAKEDSRSLANLAEIFVRKGIRDYMQHGGWPVNTGAGAVRYVRAKRSRGHG